VVRVRPGFLALVLCFLPIGTGAAGQLWSTVADDWHASAGTVALVTGVFGGVLSMIGCLLGGWISDRMNRQGSYVLYGLIQAACCVAMALAPRTERSYVVFTSLYAVITGLTYAGFSAFVLEAIGTGAAATKYNVFASLSNQPIAYMTLVDGWAHGHWGMNGLLGIEAMGCGLGLAVLAAVTAATRGRLRGPQPAAVPAAELADPSAGTPG
jgi:MFS transporter, PAT family, beta-lactamase induction signal transducer AmpG